MFLVGLLEWWYGPGWRQRLEFVSNHMDSVIDYFSFGLLIKTLFTPFRQDSAQPVNGSMDVKLRALLDNIIARMIGAVLRIFLMIFGAIFFVISLFFNLFLALIWAILPIMPVFGVILMILKVLI